MGMIFESVVFRSSGTRRREKFWPLGTSGLDEGDGSINGRASEKKLSMIFESVAFRSSGTRWREKLWPLGTSGLDEGDKRIQCQSAELDVSLGWRRGTGIQVNNSLVRFSRRRIKNHGEISSRCLGKLAHEELHSGLPILAA